MAVAVITLPLSPTLLHVLSVAPDGSETERGTLMAAAAQVPRLVSPESSPLQRETFTNVARVLKLPTASLRFCRFPASAPAISLG